MIRKLQSLVIYDPITGLNYTGSSGPPTESTGPQSRDREYSNNTQDDERPKSVVACSRTTSQGTSSSLSTTTVVQFYYNVETNTTNVSNGTLDKDFPAYLNGNMIQSISTDICDETTGSSSSSSNTNTNSTGTTSSKCVLSVSSGSVDQRLVSPCQPSITSSKSCTVYKGTIHVAHTDECTASKVNDDVLSRLDDVVQDDAFLDDVNRRTPYRDGVLVTKVELADSIYNESSNKSLGGTGGGGTGTGAGSVSAAQVESQNATNDGISGAAIAFIVLLGFIFLFLIILFCMNRRRKAQRWKRHQEEKLERKSRSAAAMGADEDDQSLRTDWSVGKSSMNDEEERYNQPDYHNLGKIHNTVDVHTCRSAMCPICNNFKNLGNVSMVPVRPQDLNDYQVLKQQKQQNIQNQQQRGILKNNTNSMITSGTSDHPDDEVTCNGNDNNQDERDAQSPMTIRNNVSLLDDEDTDSAGNSQEFMSSQGASDDANDVTYVRKSRWDRISGRNSQKMVQQHHDEEKSVQL